MMGLGLWLACDSCDGGTELPDALAARVLVGIGRADWGEWMSCPEVGCAGTLHVYGSGRDGGLYRVERVDNGSQQ